jgi:hypothetical protein
MLKQMWEKLDAFTISAADGSERDINVRNEWGGFSRRLKMPVTPALPRAELLVGEVYRPAPWTSWQTPHRLSGAALLRPVAETSALQTHNGVARRT